MLLLAGILGLAGLAYLCWSPGRTIRDGRHDLRSNGIWLQHGWLGDDSWFQRNGRDKDLYRSDVKMQELASLLADHGMKYVFPHACPCRPSGAISPVDDVQAERFLDHFEGFEVIPWIGGVLDTHCSPESPQWRSNFVHSAAALLLAHPRLAGVQVNIEPLPSGSSDFLLLLEELRAALPPGRIISVAAYPPPTRWHPFPDVHWEEGYFRQVAGRSDLIVPMMYDTAVRLPKLYCHIMASWTADVIEWAGETGVLLGIPAYDDADSGYHFPSAENLEHAISGIHAGLSSFPEIPQNYAGTAIYCEWEMDVNEWVLFRKEFEKAR